MLFVGCSGFPVPATRYLREFMLDEVSDTQIGVPGPALVRRWRREAPSGFVYTAIAPKEVAGDAFKPAPNAPEVWQTFLGVAKDLAARAIVILSPAEVPANKTTRAAARAMLEAVVKPGVPQIVWEAPAGWELRDAESVAKDLGVIVARDPSRQPAFGAGTSLAYYRLPGAAGYKSRYEDPTLEVAAKTIRESSPKETFVVLANVDSYADSKRLKKLLEA